MSEKHQALDREDVSECRDFLAEMGHEDPEEMRLKFSLASRIARIIDERDLRQNDAATLTGVPQPDVSKIVNGRVKGYSVWKLMKMAAALGQDVHVSLAAARADKGAIFAD